MILKNKRWQIMTRGLFRSLSTARRIPFWASVCSNVTWDSSDWSLQNLLLCLANEPHPRPHHHFLAPPPVVVRFAILKYELIAGCCHLTNTTPLNHKYRAQIVRIWLHFAASVCPSVLLSVTFVYCVKTSNHILKLCSLLGNQVVLVFPYQTL